MKYSSANVQHFPAGSNVDPTDVDYDEEDEIVYEDGVPKIITGTLHAALFPAKENGEDDSGEDDDSYQSNSVLDNEFVSDQKYTLTLISRQKNPPQKRSTVMVRVDDTHGLQTSSVESKHGKGKCTAMHHPIVSRALFQPMSFKTSGIL